MLGYLNVHPELYRSIPNDFGGSASAPSVGIAWDEDDAEDPPLEYVSESFSGLEVWTTVVEVNSFWSLWNRPLSEVEYQWEYMVKNLTSENRDISVTYQLENSAGKVLASSSGSVLAEPNETVVITGDDRIPYFDAQQVAGSGWLIRHSVKR